MDRARQNLDLRQDGADAHDERDEESIESHAHGEVGAYSKEPLNYDRQSAA